MALGAIARVVTTAVKGLAGGVDDTAKAAATAGAKGAPGAKGAAAAPGAAAAEGAAGATAAGGKGAAAAADAAGAGGGASGVKSFFGDAGKALSDWKWPIGIFGTAAIAVPAVASMVNTSSANSAAVKSSGLGADALIHQSNVGAQNNQAMWAGLAEQQRIANQGLQTLLPNAAPAA